MTIRRVEFISKNRPAKFLSVLLAATFVVAPAVAQAASSVPRCPGPLPWQDGGSGKTQADLRLLGAPDLRVQSSGAVRTSSTYRLQFCIVNVGTTDATAPIVTRLQVNGATLATFTHPSNIAPQANACFGSTTTNMPFTNTAIDAAVLVIQAVSGETETANNTCGIDWTKETRGTGTDSKGPSVRSPSNPK